MAEDLKRTQIYIEREAAERLDEIAEQRGTTRSELIRSAIGDYLARQKPVTTTPNEFGFPIPDDWPQWKKDMFAVCGMWEDYPEIEDIIAESRAGVERRLKRVFEEE
jgi:hypothetical protein